MFVDQRKDLLRILTRLDQLESTASEITAQPMYFDVAVQAEELCQLLADMRAKVEQHLEGQNN